jgi:methylisocitrate lyase
MPGAYDALSARIIEAQGFEAMVAGGYAAAGSLLGQADMGQSNMRDFADHYGRICDAVQIPVYADADTGFGGCNNVRQMVKAFEKAGVAALFFNDQVVPSRCGYLPGKQVVSLGEDEAIRRCRLFMEAGADMAKPQGIDTEAGVRRVLRDVPGPFIATLSQAAGPGHLTPARLEEIGVSGATLPSFPLFVAAKALRDALRDLHANRSLVAIQDRLLPLDDYYDLVGLGQMLDRERAFDDDADRILRRAAKSN